MVSTGRVRHNLSAISPLGHASIISDSRMCRKSFLAWKRFDPLGSCDWRNEHFIREIFFQIQRVALLKICYKMANLVRREPCNKAHSLIRIIILPKHKTVVILKVYLGENGEITWERDMWCLSVFGAFIWVVWCTCSLLVSSLVWAISKSCWRSKHKFRFN